VLAIDSEHSSRVSALERALRSRNRLLEVRNYDDHWCDAIERETAELAVAVAATRGQTAVKLAAMLRARGQASAFPSAEIALDGWMENALLTETATSVEDRYRQILHDNRPRDAIAGRTTDGPHLTDLQVVYAPKNMPAKDASTGEQKALLIGLVLAHANLVAEMTGIIPLLLLDDAGVRLGGDLAGLGREGFLGGDQGVERAALGRVSGLLGALRDGVEPVRAAGGPDRVRHGQGPGGRCCYRYGTDHRRDTDVPAAATVTPAAGALRHARTFRRGQDLEDTNRPLGVLPNASAPAFRPLITVCDTGSKPRTPVIGS